MRVENQPAYILHQRPFRDTSQIIEVFSKDYGRLSVMSRGSRGAKSRLKSVLQPFRALVIGWSGRGEMPTLISAESASQSVLFLQGKSLACALYINELLMYLTYKHDVHELLFSQYHQTINRLIETDQLEQELRKFELNLLDNLGVPLDFQHEAGTSEPIDVDSDYYFQIEQGFFRYNDTVNKNTNVIVSGTSLLAMAELDFEQASTLKDAKKLMRSIINHYLGDKTLRSRELFR